MARFRLKFTKGGDLRWLSHLELTRTLIRSLVRSGAPLKYTEGFSPHPRISLSPALPVGTAGTAEYLDLWLEAPVEAAKLLERLNINVPEGISIIAVKEIPADTASLGSSICLGDYEIVLSGGGATKAAINRGWSEYRRLTAGPTSAKKRNYAVDEVRLIDTAVKNGQSVLKVRLPIDIKPSALVEHIQAIAGVKYDRVLYNRTALWACDDGVLKEPMDAET